MKLVSILTAIKASNDNKPRQVAKKNITFKINCYCQNYVCTLH